MRIDEPEVFCGLQQTVTDRETSHGTKYEIIRWSCPNCGKACSCINVDGEWCHGDALSISFGPEKDPDGTWTRHHKCTACWLTPGVAPSQAPEQPLPYWEPCNPGCDPEFNGQRDRHCAKLCKNARDALGSKEGS